MKITLQALQATQTSKGWKNLDSRYAARTAEQTVEAFSTEPVGDIIRDTEIAKRIIESLQEGTEFSLGGYTLDKEDLQQQVTGTVSHFPSTPFTVYVLKTGDNDFEVVHGCGVEVEGQRLKPLIGDPLPVKLPGDKDFHSSYRRSGALWNTPVKIAE